jgi:hypothetical protein
MIFNSQETQYDDLDCFKEMAKLLTRNKCLTEINLGRYYTSYNAKGEEILMDALIFNKSLIRVKCGSSSFGNYLVQCQLKANKHTENVSNHFPLMNKVKFHEFNFKIK